MTLDADGSRACRHAVVIVAITWIVLTGIDGLILHPWQVRGFRSPVRIGKAKLGMPGFLVLTDDGFLRPAQPVRASLRLLLYRLPLLFILLLLCGVDCFGFVEHIALILEQLGGGLVIAFATCAEQQECA